MDVTQAIILIFTKYPSPGKVKTRLIPHLGREKAAELQHHMGQAICATIRQALITTSWDNEKQTEPFSPMEANRQTGHAVVYYDGGSPTEMHDWLGDGFTYRRQSGDDLGQRMANGIFNHLGTDKPVILIGTDCPDLDAAILQNSIDALHDHDAVFGPAYDGGYYLIGVRGDIAKGSLAMLFSDISWGTSSVLAQTVSRAKTMQLRYTLLKRLHDIDTPEDLGYLHNHPCA
ncbi:MAG: TIGR04282 family arsenosugar biosynthesis glycosyltransferase [Desulfopila sp.]